MNSTCNKISMSAFICAVALATQAANPNVSNGVATYNANAYIGVKAIPSSWNKIVINANVTLTGRFEALDRTSDLTIEGKNRNTSIIKGRPRKDDPMSESKAGIRKNSGKLTVKNLKIIDQPGRGIMGWGGQLTVNNCNIIQNPNDSWSDGIHASKTGDINGCFINVYDDATYATMCDDITKTTFIHRRNGAPIQISWGDHSGDNNEKRISDCNFRAKHTKRAEYNCGMIDWKHTKFDGDSIRLKFSGTNKRTTVNSSMQHAPKYSFGNWNNTKRARSAKIKVKGWAADLNDVRNWTGSTGKTESY